MAQETRCQIKRLAYREGRVDFVASGWVNGGHVTVVSDARHVGPKCPLPAEQLAIARDTAVYLMSTERTR